MNKDKAIGSLLVIISAITFGSLPLFSNFAYNEGTSVATLLFLRFFSASTLLWLYIIIKKIDFKVNKNTLIHLILISLLGYSISASGLFYSYKYISSSLATIILYCYPILVVAYEMFRCKQIDAKKIFCLSLTSLGLILVVGVSNAKINWFGVLLALISAIGYAYFCIGLEKKGTQSLNSMVISTYVMTSCALIYMIQCLFTEQSLLPPNTISLYYATIIGVFCSIVPTITLYEGVKKIGIGNSVIISSFEPVFACVLSSVFLHEILTLSMIIGGLIIIFSLVLLQLPCRKLFSKKRKTCVKDN